MNIFRLTGDISHLLAIIILLIKIWRTRSCAGISGKSQVLYAIVFTTRYLDLFTNFVSYYNTFMKVVFILCTYATLALILWKFRTTYDSAVTITASAEPLDDPNDDNDDTTKGITITDSDGLIGAGFNRELDLEGSLTVKATDAGSRAFEIEGSCDEPGAKANIKIEDKDLEMVATGAILCLKPLVTHPADTISGGADYSVASYGDWTYHDVTDGFVISDLDGVVHMVNDHPSTVMGWLDRDEPVVQTYQLGISDVERLTQRNDPEMGQDTVEVLIGSPNVQLTVTAGEEGPAYIRFLDSDMQPFGTDVDEEPMYRGADVVGLDSQGRLVMNRTATLSAAKALAYDQYEAVVPGDPTINAYLNGKADAYYQGSFRFFDPCPASAGAGHSFYVQVYEKTGKYLKTTEKVVCIAPPRIVPSALAVTTYSDHPGEARLTWSSALGATAHWVIVFEQATSAVVPGSMQKIDAPTEAADIRGLSENVNYVFAVAAERQDASGAISYSAPSFIIQAMNWENGN